MKPLNNSKNGTFRLDGGFKGLGRNPWVPKTLSLSVQKFKFHSDSVAVAINGRFFGHQSQRKKTATDTKDGFQCFTIRVRLYRNF